MANEPAEDENLNVSLELMLASLWRASCGRLPRPSSSADLFPAQPCGHERAAESENIYALLHALVIAVVTFGRDPPLFSCDALLAMAVLLLLRYREGIVSLLIEICAGDEVVLGNLTVVGEWPQLRQVVLVLVTWVDCPCSAEAADSRCEMPVLQG